MEGAGWALQVMLFPSPLIIPPERTTKGYSGQEDGLVGLGSMKACLT